MQKEKITLGTLAYGSLCQKMEIKLLYSPLSAGDSKIIKAKSVSSLSSLNITTITVQRIMKKKEMRKI